MERGRDALRQALSLPFATVRKFALSLPETAEMPHHEMTSFRVRGKIFATATPNEEFLHVFVDDAERVAVVKGEPEACENLYWGKKVMGVRITLARAKAGMVKELLRSAWRFKAPKALRGE